MEVPSDSGRVKSTLEFIAHEISIRQRVLSAPQPGGCLFPNLDCEIRLLRAVRDRLKDEYYISDDGRWFRVGPFSTREGAIAKGRVMYAGEFWIGVKDRVVEDLISEMDLVGCLADAIDDHLYKNAIGDEDPIVEFQKEDRVELNQIISNFVRERRVIPDKYTMLSVEKIQPESEEEE